MTVPTPSAPSRRAEEHHARGKPEKIVGCEKKDQTDNLQ